MASTRCQVPSAPVALRSMRTLSARVTVLPSGLVIASLSVMPFRSVRGMASLRRMDHSTYFLPVASSLTSDAVLSRRLALSDQVTVVLPVVLPPSQVISAQFWRAASEAEGVATTLAV